MNNLNYVWISLESHRSTLYRAITPKTLKHNNQVSTSSNSPLGSESLSITIESLIIKFQFQVILPSSRLNHAKTSLNRVWIILNYVYILWITFESHCFPFQLRLDQLRITLYNFKPTVHRVISLKTLKQKLFTCSSTSKTIRNTFCNFLTKVWRTTPTPT